MFKMFEPAAHDQLLPPVGMSRCFLSCPYPLIIACNIFCYNLFVFFSLQHCKLAYAASS